MSTTSRRQAIISSGSVRISIKLRDTPTAELIWEALPLLGSASSWGEEIYFSIPVTAEQETDAKTVVEAGDIAYWPDGQAIAIGFGPTPISNGDEIRLAAPCNIWADAVEDVRTLINVQDGDEIRVEREG